MGLYESRGEESKNKELELIGILNEIFGNIEIKDDFEVKFDVVSMLKEVLEGKYKERINVSVDGSILDLLKSAQVPSFKFSQFYIYSGSFYLISEKGKGARVKKLDINNLLEGYEEKEKFNVGGYVVKMYTKRDLDGMERDRVIVVSKGI